MPSPLDPNRHGDAFATAKQKWIADAAVQIASSIQYQRVITSKDLATFAFVTATEIYKYTTNL